MKTRVLFGVCGFVFVLLALYVLPPVVLEVLMAAMCVIACHELLGAAKLVRNRMELSLCMVAAAALAAGHSSLAGMDLGYIIQALICIMLFGSFAIELKSHQSMGVEQVAWGFFGGLLLPYLLLSLLRIFQMKNGQFLVLLPLLAAWGADTFALFSGMLFGKHKLAPVVSPKKTVEGAVGGVIGGMVFVAAAVLIMDKALGSIKLPLWAAIVLGGVGAMLGEVGDLSFSIIKRQNQIKDYGTIFPGHGGVLDRFDSVIFVAPFAELLFRAIG